MAGGALGSGCWDCQAASGLSMRSHSWLAHSSASEAIQSRAVLFSWILSKFLRVVRRKTKKQCMLSSGLPFFKFTA